MVSQVVPVLGGKYRDCAFISVRIRRNKIRVSTFLINGGFALDYKLIKKFKRNRLFSLRKNSL
jgi:hypothetical protein